MEITTKMDNVTDMTSLSPTGGINEPKYLDHTTYKNLQTLRVRYAEIHGYISVLVCLFGIIANIANIVVLNKKHMRTSTNVILMWLAVADLCTMTEYVPFALRFYIFKDPDLEFPDNKSYSWMCYLLFHADFSLTMHSMSIWLTIMLAIFRFLYVFLPTKGSIYCSIKHAKIIIITVYVLAVLVCIPNYISNYWSKSVRNISNENVTVYTFSQRKDEDKDFETVFAINYWVQSILIKLVPCFLLTVLTILLITALHKAHKRHVHLKSQGMRKDDVEKHHEHFRTTAMLLAVVILFLITELPQGILTLLMIFMDTLHAELYNPLGDILDIVALLNNAINFVLYCSMSQQFRDTFVATFCGCFKRNTNPNASVWAKRHLITANGTSTKTTNLQENGQMV
ncbi:G-protein coupled receptor dmsr-1-like [Mercenaria mercenaria]|uniref:G-protein coupled receptor dmsr-1-like n=1 Tax=Mercenaria mercenaria TaxID=6596 RepID=UPI001E1DB6B8|nr:G-protein coupled receptor dmsr-1-like [Mercenaria mercenaria]XP_045188631.1 G-protein coupled receptor dmsr-1-like [Mercenaria mercenaria]XP_045188632.1 G-protein coupled receptor dmsr-1-like [Mercenaria mercenaria]XP_045188633.1 G-protein coupled receptor dmsr-1-like [Mercenaria mercenaria]